MDLAIQRMVFLKARHTLDFCFNKTKMKLGSFHRRALAEFIPVFLNGSLIQFRDLAKGKLKTFDVFIRLARFRKSLGKDGLNNVKFAH